MPTAAPRPCSHPGCHVLVRDGTGRCEKHPRPVWTKPKKPATKRITGRRLQRMREELFSREPLCVVCKDLGLVVPATQRDHIVSLEEGGADDASNAQGLCDEHHEEKSKAERLRGRMRGRM